MRRHARTAGVLVAALLALVLATWLGLRFIPREPLADFEDELDVAREADVELEPDGATA